MKKIVIIGSVAAGTSVAAKARRNREDVEITVLDKGSDISYSVCGIPYYIGGNVSDIDELMPQNSKGFKELFNIDINTEYEVNKINDSYQTITVTNLVNDEKMIQK